jgi:hypothetical protein
LPNGQHYGETLLSPNGFAFSTLVRNESLDGRTSHDPPLKYLIFDTRIKTSYLWTLDVKKEFGTEKKEYPSPYNIEMLADDLLTQINGNLNNNALRLRLRNWLLFLNDDKIDTSKNEIYLTEWIVPLEGSLLYMLGMQDLSFSVNMEILKGRYF